MTRERIIDSKIFSYTGLLNFQKLYSSIKEFWESKGFDCNEKSHEERVKDDGSRSIKLNWSCERKVTDYIKYIFEWTLEIENMKLSDLKDTKLEYVENMKVVINGDIDVDYGKLWGDKPFNIFLRALFEKYLYDSELREYKKTLGKIGEEFLNLLKDHTASYKI